MTGDDGDDVSFVHDVSVTFRRGSGRDRRDRSRLAVGCRLSCLSGVLECVCVVCC